MHGMGNIKFFRNVDYGL